jgi:hypothetical protein
MIEEDLIIEMWDVFKEYIPEKTKETAANHYVDFLLGKDVSQSTLEAVMNFDPSLDEAIKLVLDHDEESDDVDDDWVYLEDDE